MVISKVEEMVVVIQEQDGLLRVGVVVKEETGIKVD